VTPAPTVYTAPATACPGCKSRGKPWNGQDPKCAFHNGETFDPDNWQCATMNALRDLADRPGATHYQEDSRVAVLPYNTGDVAQDDDDLINVRGFIVLAWYKDRGTTDQAFLMDEDQKPTPLTLAVARRVLTDAGVKS
jgi:hypothetical protein